MKKIFVLFLATLSIVFSSADIVGNQPKKKNKSLSLQALNKKQHSIQKVTQPFKSYGPVERAKEVTLVARRLQNKKPISTLEKKKPSTYWSFTDTVSSLGLAALVAYVRTSGESCYPTVVPACCTKTYLPQLAPICSLTGQNVQPIPYILDCYLKRPNETCPFTCNIDDFARYADYPAPQLEI